jgi:hypothetical protein
MPEGVEYLHCVQMAVDAAGLRYQVLDTTGVIRERLSWPVQLAPTTSWRKLRAGVNFALTRGRRADAIVALRFAGRSARQDVGIPQTLLSAVQPDGSAPLWIGLRGREQRLTVIIGPEARRSPHYWLGMPLGAERPFDFQMLIHCGMGPGGIMYRENDGDAWSSLAAASPWGAERLEWPEHWVVGHGPRDLNDRAFQGADLAASAFVDFDRGER